MENASKVLLMAGSILIAILIISLGIMVYKNMSSTVSSTADMTEQEITMFNSKIKPYLGENISGSQVNALIQLVRSINQSESTIDVIILFPDGTNNSSGTYQKVETGRNYYRVIAAGYTNACISRIEITGPN